MDIDSGDRGNGPTSAGQPGGIIFKDDNSEEFEFVQREFRNM
jgi:hypothetical protein